MAPDDAPSTDTTAAPDAAGELSPLDEGRRQREHTTMQIRELRAVMDEGVASYARRLLITLILFVLGLVAGLTALYVAKFR